MKKKHDKEIEKAEKLKEKIAKEKAEKAERAKHAAIVKKRKSAEGRKINGVDKRRRASGTVNDCINLIGGNSCTLAVNTGDTLEDESNGTQGKVEGLVDGCMPQSTGDNEDDNSDDGLWADCYAD